MIFAVQGIPRKWSLGFVKNQFEPDFPGLFQPKYFEFDNKFQKTVYIQLLSNEQELGDIVQAINSIHKFRHMKLRAIVPKYVSPVYMGAAKGAKKQRVKKGKQRPNVTRTDDQLIMIVTHKEIMTELQAKYTKLYNLSRKTPGNELLERIARTVFERLNNIMLTNEEASSTCFKLSSCYRKLHPHFGDFQMILSTLHKIQDEQGAPRSQLSEADVVAVSKQLNINNIPLDKIKSATEKYSLKITKRVLEHIRNLDSEPHQMDTPEDAARKKVRAQLKNMSQHLPAMIRQVIQFNLTPEKAPFHRVRIYGEPFLPSKDTMVPFTKRFKAVHIVRSDRMYNLLKLNIPPPLYSSIMSKDGTTVGDAKLVIRSSDIPLYKTSAALIAEMKAACGVGENEEYVEEPADEAMDMDL